jgi:hypothetical protein
MFLSLPDIATFTAYCDTLITADSDCRIPPQGVKLIPPNAGHLAEIKPTPQPAVAFWRLGWVFGAELRRFNLIFATGVASYYKSGKITANEEPLKPLE